MKGTNMNKETTERYHLTTTMGYPRRCSNPTCKREHWSTLEAALTAGENKAAHGHTNMLKK